MLIHDGWILLVAGSILQLWPQMGHFLRGIHSVTWVLLGGYWCDQHSSKVVSPSMALKGQIQLKLWMEWQLYKEGHALWLRGLKGERGRLNSDEVQAPDTTPQIIPEMAKISPMLVWFSLLK
ncbi:hypothetical protein LOK49_LG11G01128 [Camellia lanceoleosa]|uniref:Uncharacterized protein n=1 Tax=Camellia lanceoleosa TaxID=1840588 RepID=A0ACC0FYF2_9ERIC|nr:hypothetical protein LOK49_LG11G01128 [Camellia lanceoleosa]